MTRTQIQLPDELYQELKRLADAKEWSLAEAVRRGVELLLRSYPSEPDAPDAWRLPEPAVLSELALVELYVLLRNPAAFSNFEGLGFAEVWSPID